MKKTLSIFLTILMVFSAISTAMPVFAEEITIEEISQAVNDEVEVIAESEELRTENSKTYIMSDGSFKMDIYSHPVFIQNEDGDWVEREVSSGTRRKAKSSIINANEISATYVSSEESNSNFANENDVVINSDCIALVRPDSLMEANLNFQVVSATMNLPVNYADDNAIVYAYNITEDWEVNDVTYSSMPRYDQVVDYCKVEDTISIDITKYINSTEFYGIAFISDDEISLSKRFDEPIYSISFIVTTGIDEDFEYTTFDMGSAGDVYINKQSGNLIVKRNDISTGSGEHSFDLTSAFNSITTLLSDKKWFLNCDTALVFLGLFYIDDTVSVNIFTNTEIDDDGYQILEDNKYGFEKKKAFSYRDYDIPLVFSNGRVAHVYLTLPDVYEVIAENGTLKYYFSTDLGLVGIKEVDEEGNETAVFAKEKINNNTVRITDGDCNTLTIVTDTSNITMTARDSEDNITDTEVLTLDENSSVTAVTVNNETIAEYEYDSDNRLIGVANEENTLSFSYEGSTGSVKTIEYKKNNVLLEKYKYKRTENVCTEQFSGNDSILNNEDDTVVTYTFDKNCRVISTEIKNIYGESFGSLAYGYKDKEIIDASYSGKQNVNYVSNSSFEHSGAWQFSSNENAVYTNAESKFGANSLMLNNTGTAEQTVEVPLNLFNNVMVASAYVKSDSDNAAFIQADIISAGNVVQTFIGERAHNTEGEWEQITTPFFMPEEYDEIKISLVNTQNSTVYFDGVSLEKSAYPEKYNLIENTRFELAGNLNEENTAYQDIYLGNAKQTDTYILSGRATAHSLPTNENRKYALEAEIFYTGSDNTKTVCIDYSSYNNEEQYGQVGFNLATDNEALIPCRIRVTADYSYNYNNAVFDNIALIKTDNVIVSDESTDSEESEEDSFYIYNDDGTISSYTDDEGNITRYLYTEGKLVSIETKNSNNEVTYRAEYNSNEDIVFEQCDGLTTTYSYNDEKLSYIETKDSSDNVVSYSEYNADGNILTDFEDNLTTLYTYYEDGSLESVSKLDTLDNFVYGELYSESGYLTDYYSNGIYYRYTYDENGNVVSKSYGLLDYVDTENYDIVDAKTINYSYDNNRCTTVICNGFEYNYAYNDFNNANALSVNGNLLESKDLYYNGLVHSRTYGNGDFIEYAYDMFGNLTNSYTDNSSFTMLYDSLNNKRLVLDSDNVITLSKYDDSGRYIGENRIQYNDNGNFVNELNRYRVYYNEDSVSKASVSSQNAMVTNNYSYSEDNNTSTSQFGNATITSTYDEDGTLQSKTGIVNETFIYNDDGLIATHTIGNDTYSYEYSDKENIISESKNNAVIRSYKYDSFGQLIRENNLDTNTTVLYNYDNGGNITSKVSYPYTTGDVDAATGTVVYTYDSDWADKLNAFGTDTISYDAIGNPINYRGAVCTYSGRQLQSYTKDGIAISYKYDENGIRTSKTVNGIQHDYYYIYDVLMYEKVGNDYELFYRYDADGNLAIITRYNLISDLSEDFAAVTNIHGDVIELLDSNSEVVATYTYDAWGNNIFVTSNDNIATQNSIRYRGYVYDNETGLYYLQSRYYDPETGRFINFDDSVYIGFGETFVSWNGFVYCKNDSINGYDPYGNISFRRGITLDEFTSDYYGGDDYSFNPNAKASLKNKFMSLSWRCAAFAVKAKYPDGYDFYKHYRDGKGKTYIYDYGKAINEDTVIRKFIDSLIEEFKKFIKTQNLKEEKEYDYSSPLDKKVAVTPKNFNWQLAIGSHLIVICATVKYYKLDKRYKADICIVAYDRYNFSSADKFHGLIPGSWNGELVTCGLAQNYTSIGLAIKQISWRK